MTSKQIERSGLGIGIITRGNVSIKWMTHMQQLQHFFPVGMFWKYIVVEDESGWAKNRIEVVRQAQKENFEWLLFIDDDVFVPKDIMQTMLAHQKDIVSGIYWTKTENEVPVIFEKEGGGPMYNFELDKLFKVAGSGLGVCLINMKVFDAFDKAGIPYFKENWIMETDDGRKLRCPIGEDHYFFHHARKLGFDVWADSGCLCDHYDMKNKVFYPKQETVRKITGKFLEDHGRQDVIEDHKKQLKEDPDKKKIVFVNFTPNSFAGDELEKRGVGGAETDVINLSRVFANEHEYDVHVFCNTDRPGLYDNVMYHDIRTNLHKLRDLNADLLISSRNTEIFNSYDFKRDFNAKKVCLWAHDKADDPVWTNLEKAYPHIDYIFALTNWHKKDIQEKFPFCKDEKFFIARNGINEKLFKNKVDRVPGRLIYSSTPFRGLEILADVFPEIKRRVPHATLNVFSSFAVYGDAYAKHNEQWEWLYAKLRGMSGVKYSESIRQKELAVEQMEAEVLAYPNIFQETSCLTVMECAAAGTPSVTSNYAALQETVEDDMGIKIDGNPYSKEYKAKFVDAVIEMLTDKDKWKKYSDACLSKDLTWSTIAKEWLRMFFREDVDSIQKVGNINTESYWNKVYAKELNMETTGRNDDKRFKYILDVLSDIENLTILDMACGTGEFTRYTRKRLPNAEIWGSDFSMVAIDHCRQLDRTIFYANHPLLNDEFDKKYFDIITAQHILEHLDNPKEIIEHAKGLLKDGGILVIALPLNDDEWKEHQKVYSVEDVQELLASFDCDVDITKRVIKEKRYKDGRPFEEVLAFVKFRGN